MFWRRGGWAQLAGHGGCSGPGHLCPPCRVYRLSTAPRGGASVPSSFQGWAELGLRERSCQAGSGGAAHALQLTHQCFQFLIRGTAGKLTLKPLGAGLGDEYCKHPALPLQSQPGTDCCPGCCRWSTGHVENTERNRTRGFIEAPRWFWQHQTLHKSPG